MDKVIDNNNAFGTYKDFIKSLDDTFMDHNKKKNVQETLANTKQGGRPAEEFFTEFDQLLRAAGYEEGHDDYLVQLLEHAVNPQIIEDIYRSGNLPEATEDITLFLTWRN